MAVEKREYIGVELHFKVACLRCDRGLVRMQLNDSDGDPCEVMTLCECVVHGHEASEINEARFYGKRRRKPWKAPER